MSGVDSEEEAVLQKHASELHMAGETWIGYIKGKNLENMLRDLTAIGVSFKTVSSKCLGSNTNRFLFSYMNGNVPLSLDAPFRLLSNTHKDCVYGKDYHKVAEKNAALLREGKLSCKTGGTRGRTRGTNKMGCKATMQIKVIEVFPDFKIEPPEGASQTKIKDMKSYQISMLFKALSSGLTVHSQIVTFFRMTRKSFHTEHDVLSLSNFGSTADATKSDSVQPEANTETVQPEPSTETVQIECGEYWSAIDQIDLSEIVIETDQINSSETAPTTDHTYSIAIATGTYEIDSSENWPITDQVGPAELLEVEVDRLSRLQLCTQKNAAKVKAMAACCASEEKLRLANSYLIKAQKLLMEQMPDGTIAISTKTHARKRQQTQASTLSKAPAGERTSSANVENMRME